MIIKKTTIFGVPVTSVEWSEEEIHNFADKNHQNHTTDIGGEGWVTFNSTTSEIIEVFGDEDLLSLDSPHWNEWFDYCRTESGIEIPENVSC